MPSQLAQPLVFLLQTLGGLYVLIVLIRFLLQLVRADFYNPLSQFVIRATNPILAPLRKLLPSTNLLDTASLLVAVVLQIILTYVILSIYGINPSFVAIKGVLLGAVLGLLVSVLNIYTFCIFVVAIASWVAPNSYNPALTLLNQIVEPLSQRIRSVIPPMGGIDFSVMALLIIIYMLKSFVLYPFMYSTIPPVILKTVLLM